MPSLKQEEVRPPLRSNYNVTSEITMFPGQPKYHRRQPPKPPVSLPASGALAARRSKQTKRGSERGGSGPTTLVVERTLRGQRGSVSDLLQPGGGGSEEGGDPARHSRLPTLQPAGTPLFDGLARHVAM